MNQRHIGIILIIVGLLLASLIYVVKVREDDYIRLVMQKESSCFLDDGTCLHADREIMVYVFGWALALALIIFGVYLGFIDKTQKHLEKHQRTITRALQEAKAQEKSKDEFSAFLAGFGEDEQKVLKAIREQDGIQQSTLRYRTGLSKTALSLMLKEFEKKGIISRKESGKTNEVYLQKKF
ncbi:TPA: MarR family transcriptional regulator [Candidatus Woesearchaeota archaeon]|nr:MarR family transcriptional regulator [Candidatus Woesearchaeota archaeon]